MGKETREERENITKLLKAESQEIFKIKYHITEVSEPECCASAMNNVKW